MHVLDLRGSLATLGFARAPGLAAPSLDRLIRATERIATRARDLSRSTGDFVLEADGQGGWVSWQQGTPALRGVLRSVSRIHEHEPEFAAIAEDLGLRANWADPLAGVPTFLVNAFFWAKPARTGSAKPWHQDMAFAPRGFTDMNSGVITMWIALDPATADSGCLQFIPASHRLGILPHIGDRERAAGEPRALAPVEPHVDLGSALPGAKPEAVPLEPGSAVIFDGRVLHQSASNTTAAARRAVSFVYAVPKSAPLY